VLLINNVITVLAYLEAQIFSVFQNSLNYIVSKYFDFKKLFFLPFRPKQARTDIPARDNSAALAALNKPPEERPDAKHHLKVNNLN
jgi:hypothetical protein